MMVTYEGSHKWSTNIKDYRVVRENTSTKTKIGHYDELVIRYYVERKQTTCIFWHSWTKIGTAHEKADDAVEWIQKQCNYIPPPQVTTTVVWHG